MMTNRTTDHHRRCRSGRERILQLVDLENLVGSTVLDRSQSIRHVPDQTFQRFSTWYVSNYCRKGDQIWAAADRSRFLAVFPYWPTGSLLAGYGLDGADKALLDKVAGFEQVAERFTTLIIASGDHIYADFARRFRAAGGRVIVYATSRSLSTELYYAADEFIPLPAEPQPA